MKRSKLRIYYDILKALNSESCNEHFSLTKISHMVNLPYDRFIKCLDKLIHSGLVSPVRKKFVLTEKGFEYIKEFERMSAFLASVGLAFDFAGFVVWRLLFFV
jgi:predicted transcriptional regulator